MKMCFFCYEELAEEDAKIVPINDLIVFACEYCYELHKIREGDHD